MIIAVNVDDRNIPDPAAPDPGDPMDPAKDMPAEKPQIIGLKNHEAFDAFVKGQLQSQNAERVRRFVKPRDPYQANTTKNHIATILDTHNSPGGCVVVYINGWPFCY